MHDEKGDGRMNLFAAADGYGSFLVSGAPIVRNAAARSVGLNMAVGRNGRLGMGY